MRLNQDRTCNLAGAVRANGTSASAILTPDRSRAVVAASNDSTPAKIYDPVAPATKRGFSSLVQLTMTSGATVRRPCHADRGDEPSAEVLGCSP